MRLRHAALSPQISGAVAALVIAVGACADSPTVPAAPDPVPSASLDVKAMTASSIVIGDEASRLVSMIENADQRAQLTASLDQLSRAMEAGDVTSARRALSAAREDLRFLESEADRDALSLALDAADESLTSTTFKHGVTR